MLCVHFLSHIMCMRLQHSVNFVVVVIFVFYSLFLISRFLLLSSAGDVSAAVEQLNQ